MVSIGQSAGSLVQGELQNLGTNVIIVFSGSRRGGGVRQGMGSMPTLTAKDAETIATECKSVAAASAIVRVRAPSTTAPIQLWARRGMRPRLDFNPTSPQ